MIIKAERNIIPFLVICKYNQTSKSESFFLFQVQKTKIGPKRRRNKLLRIRYDQTTDNSKRIARIDATFFVLFPIIFFIFNVVYWLSFV